MRSLKITENIFKYFISLDSKSKSKLSSKRHDGFEVLRALSMKSSISWEDRASCCPVKVNRRFGQIYRLHFHGQKIGQAIVILTYRFMLDYCLACCSALKIETIYFPKCRLTSTELHGVISQKTELFHTPRMWTDG
jgi:hypothetical protein